MGRFLAFTIFLETIKKIRQDYRYKRDSEYRKQVQKGIDY